jgi:PleD family two-component response regulator
LCLVLSLRDTAGYFDYFLLFIGIAAWSIEKFNSIDDMLEIADQALYKAKHTGRDKVC